MTRQGCGQIITQREPLVVFVLEGEHALIGAVLIGEKFSKVFRVFKSGRIERLEAIGFIHVTNGAQHRILRADFLRRDVAQPLGQSRLGPWSFLVLCHEKIPAGPEPYTSIAAGLTHRHGRSKTGPQVIGI